MWGHNAKRADTFRMTKLITTQLTAYRTVVTMLHIVICENYINYKQKLEGQGKPRYLVFKLPRNARSSSSLAQE